MHRIKGSAKYSPFHNTDHCISVENLRSLRSGLQEAPKTATGLPAERSKGKSRKLSEKAVIFSFRRSNFPATSLTHCALSSPCKIDEMWHKFNCLSTAYSVARHSLTPRNFATFSTRKLGEFERIRV